MQAEFVDRKDVVLRLKKVDSMGRTKEQREAMELNDPKPMPKLGDATLAVHAICADEHAQYPKSMYRLALRKGVPAGDEIAPNYPLPYDLALQCGLADAGFRVINKTATSPGNVIVRLPYITRLVGVIREDLTVDVAAAKAEEAELRAKGWVDHPSKIKGLPVAPAEEPYDPLPDDESKPNGNGRAVPSGPGNQRAQQPIQMAETPALNNSAESNKSNSKSKRGGFRPGSGRKPKIAMASSVASR